ncbi:MAG TPA: GDSL-type esterase/lipase family protein [Candidatus Saccharimonadales bacterium]|nr:GDSL-type esterase/lipase family protein [Candidatus Saccharimonadales bacterium]
MMFLSAALIAIAVVFVWLALRALLVWINKFRFQKYWQAQLSNKTSPDAIRVILFGDSISQGVGATRIKATFAGRVNAYIKETTGRPVRVENYSRSGATADQVLEQMSAADLNNADIVLLEVGANDTFRRTVEQYEADMDKVINKLPLEKTVIADLPYVKIRKPYQEVLEKLLADKQVARARASQAFSGFIASLPVTAGDFFHPNNKGYGLWFEAFQPGIDEVLRRHSLSKVKK